jgi:DUF4097 and DUF4098 domain-containing protein YvlB
MAAGRLVIDAGTPAPTHSRGSWVDRLLRRVPEAASAPWWADDPDAPAARVRPLIATDDAARRLAALAQVTTSGRDGVVVQVPTDAPRRGRLPEVVVEVRTAHGADLDLDIGAAEAICRGVAGTVRAASSSGSVHVDESIGEVQVSTGSGPVTLHRVGGPLSLRTGGGVLLVRHVAAGCQVASSSGDLHVWECHGDVDATTVSGNVRIGRTSDAPCRLAVTTTSGTLDLQVPPVASAADLVRVTTVSGDVTVEAL